jgi:glycopeptide antibiotics resistance protein
VRAPQDVRPRPLRIALVLGSVALAVLLLGPWGRQLHRLTVWLYMFFRTDLPIAPDWALPEHYGALLNVLLFVPVGVALALTTRWSWWRIALVATLGSAIVELSQATVVDRDSSGLDVVTNGLGALLGAVTVMVVRRVLARP